LESFDEIRSFFYGFISAQLELTLQLQ
jgi:hypothetical protein